MKLFASMEHKARWIEHPMRFVLTPEGLLIKLANHYTTWGGKFSCEPIYFKVYIYKHNGNFSNDYFLRLY